MKLRVGVTAMPNADRGVEFVTEAERLGADSVWVPEFWAYDALTPLAYLAARTSTIKLGTAIAQLGARTPAMLAMSAMSIQSLSGGRLRLGIGTSGPQVMEGWHGVEFTKPIERTRDTVGIIRTITAGQRLEHHGSVYTLPLPGGEGRSLRTQAEPVHVPIYIASLGPRNLVLTGEVADGWIGNSFFPESAPVFFDPIRHGAETVGRSFGDLDLTVAVGVEFTDDAKRPGAATRGATRSRLAPWARSRTTSTTTPSPAKASATTCERCSGCGSPVNARRRPSGCRSRSASGRTSSGRPTGSRNDCGSIGTRASRRSAPASRAAISIPGSTSSGCSLIS
jgi:F420-dependent oxidoreductase-like protein